MSECVRRAGMPAWQVISDDLLGVSPALYSCVVYVLGRDS